MSLDIEDLIGNLQEISEPGFGYSTCFAGSQFLPAGTESFSVLVIGATRSTKSETLCEIVKNGAAAVPFLLEHLGDRRIVRLQPLAGMMFTTFDDDCDVNRRTSTVPLEKFTGFKSISDSVSHSITIGDLCFVALGQIVNRNYSAARYRATGGLIVNSPTHSEVLRQRLLNEWSGLTQDSHRDQLISDFWRPDHVDRRIGAYQRLAYYYPDSVEELVIELLARPVYDCSLVDDFCQTTLRTLSCEAERRIAFDEFIRQHGPVYRSGVLSRLYVFDDEKSLKQLYGMEHRDPNLCRHPDFDVASSSDRTQFVGCLTQEKSQKIGDVIKDLFEANLPDKSLSSNCLFALAGRGYSELLLQQLERFDEIEPAYDPWHQNVVHGIGRSGDPAIKRRLLQLIETTNCEACLLGAEAAFDRSHDSMILEAAHRVLDNLTEDCCYLGTIRLIRDRFPDALGTFCKRHLATGNWQVAESICFVLFGNSLAKSVLSPLLNDKRLRPGPSEKDPLRLCDHAAEAICAGADEIRFHPADTVEGRDQQIDLIKQYCQRSLEYDLD